MSTSPPENAPPPALATGQVDLPELIHLGASSWVAESVAALSRRWWHNSRSAIHNVLTIAYFDRLGVPRLS